MAINSTILAWKIPGTEDSGRLQSMGLQKGLTILKRLNNKQHIDILIHICMLAREDRKVGKYRGEESRQKACKRKRLI